MVGVLSEGFWFPNPDGEFWIPFVVPPFTPPAAEPGQTRMRLMMVFRALGRLAPGVSPGQAAAEAGTLLRSDGLRMLPAGGSGRFENDARVVPLLEELVGGYRPALRALTAATALVLLIACVNLAGLLLARGVTRQRALAVCAALGSAAPAARPAAPDRERDAGRGRRRAGAGRGGAGAARGAGARPR